MFAHHCSFLRWSHTCLLCISRTISIRAIMRNVFRRILRNCNKIKGWCNIGFNNLLWRVFLYSLYNLLWRVFLYNLYNLLWRVFLCNRNYIHVVEYLFRILYISCNNYGQNVTPAAWHVHLLFLWHTIDSVKFGYQASRFHNFERK